MLSISKLRTICCELYTKIQKMKAIHNKFKLLIVTGKAVNYTQRYKMKGIDNKRLDPLRVRGSCELYKKIQK